VLSPWYVVCGTIPSTSLKWNSMNTLIFLINKDLSFFYISHHEAAFFKDTSYYFSLLNLKSLIERFCPLRNLWEGEREKFIKYVKAEMNTICDTETYMPCALNSLLCMHCLNNFMKDNQHYQEPNISKMRDFKLYKSRDALHEDFSTGKMLSGVIVKLPDCYENIYVCYEERNNSQIMFE
jgi:hypothetical protein